MCGGPVIAVYRMWFATHGDLDPSFPAAHETNSMLIGSCSGPMRFRLILEIC